MVVQHNITAMNSNRMLGVTTSSQAKSTEKLSSGYKINRSADDASGLSISEKMRKQIRGLTQASANAQDGISTVQTAEGALNEVHDMLQRMNELAVKASNGTLSESDRNDVQKEVNALVNEIDRVSTTTKFNETYLLKGNNGGEVGKLTYDEVADGLSITDDGTAEVAFETGDVASSDTNTEVTSKKVSVNSVTYNLIESTKKAGSADEAASAKSVSDVLKEQTQEANNKYFSSMDDLLLAIKQDNGTDLKSVTTKVDSSGLKVKLEAFADLNDPLDISLHVGADSSDDNKINLNINQMSARGLGINGLDVSGDKADKATAAIDTIKDAIARVSSQRSTLGGVQNRLEHTIKNVDNVIENTTSAEASIRDTDMATEMVQYSKNNILAQAGQSMLAQANQSNQGVLSLLG